MRFIHTADLHLGYKYSSSFSDDTALSLNENHKKVLSNIIDLGLNKKIDALFIAGDLFDSNSVSASLISFVKSEFNRADFKIFIVCGNHDPKTKDSIYENEDFGENVYIFSSDIEKVTYKDADIYGYSFSSYHKIDNTLKDFKVSDEDKLNIILLHADLVKDSYYNPVTSEDIINTKADYVALGHIHLNPDINKADKTYFGYSGTPQGTTFKETGDMSVFLCELEKGFLKYEKVPVYEHIFKELTVNLDNIETNDDIISLVKSKISDFNISKTLFNINITGYIKDGFNLDKDYILGELSKNLLYIKSDFNLTTKYNLDLLKEEDSIRGEFIRNALKELKDEDPSYIMKVIEYGVKKLWL